MSPLMFVLLVLAAYRLTRLIAVDDITAPLRDRVHGWLGELVTCPFCVGVWLSAALVGFAVGLDVVHLRWAAALIVIAAVAGGQSLCASLDNGLNG